MSAGSDPKLPAKAEALLANWPLREPDWDAFGERIVERATAAPASGGVVSEAPSDPFAAPLPAEPGEDGFVASADQDGKAEATRERAPAASGKSLAELARASVKRKSEAARDMALESLVVASQARARAEEAGARPPAAPPEQARSVPAPKDLAPPPGAWVEEHDGSPPSSAARPAVPSRKASSRGPWIVSGIAALTAAAALIVAIQKPDPLPLAQGPSAPAPALQTKAPEQPSAVERAPSAPAPAAAPHEPAATLAPEEPAPPRPGAAPPAPKAAGTPLAAPVAPSAAPSGVKPEAIVLEDEEPAATPAPAVAPEAPSAAPLRPAELPSGGLPDKPSTGAVNAAIGSVMGSARACVAGHDEPSSARIVFGSDGKVQSVSVSGPAAGTPAQACIESAFKRARVQPFAAPSFSIGATVRPQ